MIKEIIPKDVREKTCIGLDIPNVLIEYCLPGDENNTQILSVDIGFLNSEVKDFINYMRNNINKRVLVEIIEYPNQNAIKPLIIDIAKTYKPHTDRYFE